MKKYILELIDADIRDLSFRLETCKAVIKRFPEDAFYLKRLSAIEKKLIVVQKYRERILNTL